jgi:hypothetical protein
MEALVIHVSHFGLGDKFKYFFKDVSKQFLLFLFLSINYKIVVAIFTPIKQSNKTTNSVLILFEGHSQF